MNLTCSWYFSTCILFILTATGMAQEPVPVTPSPTLPPGFHRLSATEKRAAKSSLEPVWGGYQSDVISAEIEYLSLIFDPRGRKLSCEQFEKELEQISLVPDEGLTRRLVEQFCPDQLTGDAEHDQAVLASIGDWRTYRHQGNDRRCVSKVFEHVMLDDLHLMADHPNRGVRAYRRGAGKYWFETMDWFRILPHGPLFDAAQLSTDDAGQYRLEYFGPTRAGETETYASWMTINADDGLPLLWKLYSPHTGQILRLEIFRDTTLYPGGVLCPAVHIKVNFKEEKVSTVRMSVIQSAKFNERLSDDAFVMTAPKDWAWFDWQLDRQDGGRFEKPVTNVAEFFRTRTAAPGTHEIRTTSGASSLSWRSLLLVLNGSILIIVGIALWKRSSS